MLLPPMWTAADNKEVFVYLPLSECGGNWRYTSPIIQKMMEFYWYQHKRHIINHLSKCTIEWKHAYRTYCSWGSVVNRKYKSA